MRTPRDQRAGPGRDQSFHNDPPERATVRHADKALTKSPADPKPLGPAVGPQDHLQEQAFPVASIVIEPGSCAACRTRTRRNATSGHPCRRPAGGHTRLFTPSHPCASGTSRRL